MHVINPVKNKHKKLIKGNIILHSKLSLIGILSVKMYAGLREVYISMHTILTQLPALQIK